MRCNEEGFRQRRATLLGRTPPQHFPLAAEEWSQALVQLRRFRHRGNWPLIGSNDTYWNKAFLVALIEMIDMLTPSQPEQAEELSQQSLLVAQRIRVDDCPKRSDTGKNSLLSWAYAAQASVLAAKGRQREAKATFEQAASIAGKPAIFPWAKAEVDRRHAAFLLSQGELEGLTLVNRALRNCGQCSLARAATLAVRAEFFDELHQDPSGASQDLSRALDLIDRWASPRAAHMWAATLQRLIHLHAVSQVDISSLELTYRRIKRLSKELSHNEGQRRALCTWAEALMMAPLGATRGAKRLLIRANAALSKRDDRRSVALCSVDLALLHLRDGEKPLALAALEGLPEAPIHEEELSIFRYELFRLVHPNHLAGTTLACNTLDRYPGSIEP